LCSFYVGFSLALVLDPVGGWTPGGGLGETARPGWCPSAGKIFKKAYEILLKRVDISLRSDIIESNSKHWRKKQ
jgi:hypothetical protein